RPSHPSSSIPGLLRPPRPRSIPSIDPWHASLDVLQERAYRRLMKTLLTFAAALTVTASAALAQAPRDQLVVSAAWLQQHASDPDLVLLHVGNKATYDAGHIPGA